MTRKPVIYNGERIGEASTWRDVAELLTNRLGPLKADHRTSEGPDGFHIETRDNNVRP